MLISIASKAYLSVLSRDFLKDWLIKKWALWHLEGKNFLLNDLGLDIL